MFNLIMGSLVIFSSIIGLFGSVQYYSKKGNINPIEKWCINIGFYSLIVLFSIGIFYYGTLTTMFLFWFAILALFFLDFLNKKK